MAGFEIIKKERESEMNKILQPVAVYILLLAVFAAYTSVFELDISFATIGLLLMFATGLSYYIQLFKWNRKRAIVASAILVIVVIWGLVYGRQTLAASLNQGIGLFIKSFIELYNEYYEVNIPTVFIYEDNSALLMTVFLIQFLLGLVISFVIRKGKGIVLTLLVVLLPICLAAIVGYMPGVNSSLGLIAATIFYVICYKNQEEVVNKKELTVTVILLAALFIVSLIFTPVLKNYVDNHSDQYQSVRDKLYGLSKRDFLKIEEIEAIESKSETGYSKGGVGKGDLANAFLFRPSGEIDLEISVTEKPKENLYLRAYTGTEYTGEKWEEMKSSTFSKIISPLFGDKNKRLLFSEPFQRVTEGLEVIGKQHIQIEIENASSDYAYTPYYVLIPDEDKVVTDAYVDGKGKTWRAYDYFYGSDVEKIDSTNLGMASDLWQEYREFVEEEYLDYPDNLNRLESLCENINNISRNDVSRYIDVYFENKLKYSFMPGKCPEDEEFVEYFLFDSQRGFCVHFATAATIIYRMCGYPSRYVEGYMVSSDAFVLQSDGTYKAIVTDDMAHAWSETFDEEIGWQVREHTLGYSENQTSANQNVTNPNNETEQVTTQNNNRTEQESVTTSPAAEQGETTTAESQIGGTVKGEKTEEKKVTKTSSGFKFVVVGLFVAIVIVILQRRIRRKRKVQSFRKVKQNIGITNIYNAVYEICVFQGMKKSNKSDRETLEDMKAEFAQLKPEEWDWMYECAEKAAFTSNHIGRDEQRQMYKLYKRFRKDIRSEMGIVKKILFLYIRAM